MYTGGTTGNRDDATRVGLQDYHRAEGLKVAGTLNKLTLEKMSIELTDKQNAFFFQAEDGIRDLTVTGVQTCALPISKQDPLEVVTGYWSYDWYRERAMGSKKPQKP